MSLQKQENRHKTEKSLKVRTHPRGKKTKPKEPGTYDRILTRALLGLLFITVAAVIYIILNPPQGEKFTEFYILGPEQKAYNYPIDLETGQTGTVYIGVANHEYEDLQYSLRIRLDNSTLDEKTIELRNNQTYLAKYTFTPSTPGESRKLEFLLYKKGNSTVYRTLHLWVNVKEAE
ncbi:MAG: DUF1616 domain-containing protein [Candidatus Altiarchaeia archaeon]